MDIDENENPNPNSTTSPPDTGVEIPPIEPSVPLLPTAILPPIAPIPRPLAPIPTIRPQNGDAAGNRTKSDANSEEEDDDSAPEYEVSEESRLFREKQEKAKQDFLMKQRAAALAVPTNDKAVRSRLRRLGEPVTLFGEREMERRDRLRMIMAKLDSEGQLERLMNVLEEEAATNAVGMEDGGGEDEGEAVQYPFYTEGSTALLKARYAIAKDSVVKAALRLGRARRKRDDPDEDIDAEINWALENATSFGLDCSEIADDRPLSGCSFSCDGKFLATWYISFTLNAFAYVLATGSLYVIYVVNIFVTSYRYIYASKCLLFSVSESPLRYVARVHELRCEMNCVTCVRMHGRR